jgi:predicted nucleic acid-binding Zn ribbon protein
MEKAGDFLGKMLRRLDRPEAALAWLSSAWPSIVGRTLAAHTRPVRFAKGLLELTADSKAWRNQLETMQHEFCNRINQSWGGTLVREVKFVAAKPGPARISHEADNEHTPFIRRRRG